MPMVGNFKNSFNAALLGGAAVVMVAGASQAADLPSRKSEPVSYVKICDAFGAGFFVLPGSNTCVRVGASVQIVYYGIPAQTTLALGQAGKGALSGASANGTGFSGVKNLDYSPANGGGIYQTAATQDVTGSQVDIRVRADSRTITDYGVLRTFAGLRFKFESGVMAGSGTALAANGEGGSEFKPAIDAAFIQFAGLTAGYYGTPFSFYYEDEPVTALTDPHGSPAVLNYTFAFDNGFSALIGIENPGFHLDKGGAAGSASCCSGLDANGVHGGAAGKIGAFGWPDVDVNVRYDQPWGAVQLSGLLHNINVLAVNSNGLLNGMPTQALPTLNVHGTGWAVLAGVEINLPQLGDLDKLWLQGVYGNGALEATGIGGNQGNLSYGSQTRLLGGFQRQDMDAFLISNAAGNAVRLENTTAWTLLMAYQHFFIPDVLRGNLMASYTNVTPGTTVQNTDWMAGGLSKAQEYKIGANLIWSPVKAMDIAGEVMYTKLQQKLTNDPGVAANCSAAGGGQQFAAGSPTCNILNGVKVSPGNVEIAAQVTRKF